MKITKVIATPLNIPIEVELVDVRKSTTLSVCVVEVETDTGLVGHGFTAITEEEIIAAAINEVCAPALVGTDPMNHERLWDQLYWLLSPRGQTGYAAHAIAAIDIALWDIKGRALGEPVWRLLGGARASVPLYVTFGFSMFDRDQLATAAEHWVAQGHRRLKMVVGHHGLQRRDQTNEACPLHDLIVEDAARIRAVRDAVGADIQLYIDANCSLDQYHALALARRIEQYDISFFEEPITQNDVRLMADMRRQTRIPLAAGQNEGLSFRFRDLLIANAVDVVQPNVVITGGFTQCLKIAGMAAAFNVPVANGGAWPFHNMHLIGGLANGTLVEYHHVAVLVCEAIFEGLPKPNADGTLSLPTAPGLGFELNREAVRELAQRPTSRGKGKG